MILARMRPAELAETMSTPCNFIPNVLINGMGTGSGTYALLSGMFRHNFTESTRTSPGDEEESCSGSDISNIENMTDSDSC